jgi:hypothetical protein
MIDGKGLVVSDFVRPADHAAPFQPSKPLVRRLPTTEAKNRKVLFFIGVEQTMF